MKITKLSLTNFRTFKETQTIEFAPITLLFGPNSVGKSSVLLSLFYLQEILTTGECDVQKIEALDDKYIGGFKNLVTGRDTNKSITIKVEYDKTGKIGSTYAKTFELASSDNFMQQPSIQLQDQAMSTTSVCLEFIIAWSKSKETAFVERYSVSLNNEYLGSITSDTGLKSPVLNDLNFFHSLLLPTDHEDWLDDMRYNSNEYLNTHWEEAMGMIMRRKGYEYSDNFSSDGSISKLETELAGQFPIGVKTFNGALPKALTLLESNVQTESPTTDAIVSEAFSELFISPIDNLLSILQKSLCIGPLRFIPDALYQKNPHPKQRDWYHGKAAWDTLGRSETQRATINSWLHDADKLNLGYSLKNKSTVSKHFYSDKKSSLATLKQYIEELEDSMKITFSEGDIDETPDSEQKEVDIDRLKEFIRDQEKNNAKIENGKAETTADSKVVLWDTLNNIEVTSSEIGVGISQILPLVVAALDTEGGVVSCEQPELHIHPRVQVALGDLLLSNCNDKTFLIETHSEHLILRILRRLRESHQSTNTAMYAPISPEEVSVLYLEPTDNGVTVRRLAVDEDGDFENDWPDGFFDERDEELF
jgi:AAA15 family ATPase/GTPase